VARRQRDFPNAQRRAKRLRREPTLAERRFWKHLQKIEGFHFRKQVPMGPHVYDFGEMDERLLIELDGGIHNLPEVRERDVAKEAWAVSQGFRVLRIPNLHVFGTGEPAIAAVMDALLRPAGIARAGTR
jgi:very-short-patch-repair endonuclease